MLLLMLVRLSFFAIRNSQCWQNRGIQSRLNKWGAWNTNARTQIFLNFLYHRRYRSRGGALCSLPCPSLRYLTRATYLPYSGQNGWTRHSRYLSVYESYHNPWVCCNHLPSRYLSRGFFYALRHGRPDLILFLGDLFDEGVEVRWNTVFCV